MTLHTGSTYTHGEVGIGPPDVEAVRRAARYTEDPGWLAAARVREDVYYFAVYRHGEAVGQIFLHDLDRRAGTSLVGYHLFEPEARGDGLGTEALGLLKEFVAEDTDLQRLTIITTRDNTPSRRIAGKCGFRYAGPSREGPDRGLCYVWDVSR